MSGVWESRDRKGGGNIVCIESEGEQARHNIAANNATGCVSVGVVSSVAMPSKDKGGGGAGCTKSDVGKAHGEEAGWTEAGFNDGGGKAATVDQFLDDARNVRFSLLKYCRASLAATKCSSSSICLISPLKN